MSEYASVLLVFLSFGCVFTYLIWLGTRHDVESHSR